MGPLEGVKVIDMTTVLMGPYATQMLGDYGADVIKIETLDGDVTRQIGPTRHPGMGPVFLNTNRSKRSICLDLKKPAGREAVLRLIKSADVLVYNVRPQAMARLNLGYDVVSKINPRLIYAGVFGFGQDGPYAAKPAYDDLIQGATALPALMAQTADGVPRYVPNALVDRIVAAREREEAYSRVLERLYGYQLITRNCVSELLAELDAALLGARVDVDASPNFVPALSALVVKERYGVSEIVRIPSHRRARLARLYERENALRVFVRESNTITSTLYWRNSRDSTFLFFTDDVVVTRPVFGAVNLVTGVAASAVGLVTAPFDRGKRLRAGLRGAFFSLPELAFVNLRKGSFDYVPRSSLP